MDKKIFMVLVPGTIASLLVTLLISSGAVTQEKKPIQYKVIKTEDLIKAVNPKPNERLRIEVLTQKDTAKNINGSFSSLPPATPGGKPAYHYHTARESMIQILRGDATEWVEGKAVPLKPGDIIFIPPNIKHSIMNNSSTQELKYIEFFSPIASDSVQVP